MPLSCRFYKHKFPETDEVVMVNVRQIAEMGSYVNLLEYNKIEGNKKIFFPILKTGLETNLILVNI